MAKRKSVLTIWPFRVFVSPHRVYVEADNWIAYGNDVCAILGRLNTTNTITYIEIDEGNAEELET